MAHTHREPATPPRPAPARSRPAPRNPQLRAGAHQFTLRFTVTIPDGAVGTVDDLLQAVAGRINGRMFRVLGQWFQIRVANLTLTRAPAAPTPTEDPDGTV